MPQDTEYRFPFGQPVLPRKPSTRSPQPVFILGAYPSALHVKWMPPTPYKSIRAIAVDNEPTPFWCGGKEEEQRLIADWRVRVGWKDCWGVIEIAGDLNGSSGVWVAENVLRPLKAPTAWITDCLDTYRCSGGLAERIYNTYAPFAVEHELPPAVLLKHPSETEIVDEAVALHRARLLAELATAKPELVVTLGNAALRVLNRLIEPVSRELIQKLAVAGYGQRFKVTIAGRCVECLPLAHPAAPTPYQDAHMKWCRQCT
jgi:hypothetical protein